MSKSKAVFVWGPGVCYLLWKIYQRLLFFLFFICCILHINIQRLIIRSKIGVKSVLSSFQGDTSITSTQVCGRLSLIVCMLCIVCLLVCFIIFVSLWQTVCGEKFIFTLIFVWVILHFDPLKYFLNIDQC